MSTRRVQRVLLGWVLLGVAAFALLPWYFPQNVTLLRSLPGIFGAGETASGLTHALAHGRPWLWVGAPQPYSVPTLAPVPVR